MAFLEGTPGVARGRTPERVARKISLLPPASNDAGLSGEQTADGCLLPRPAAGATATTRLLVALRRVYKIRWNLPSLEFTARRTGGFRSRAHLMLCIRSNW